MIAMGRRTDAVAERTQPIRLPGTGSMPDPQHARTVPADLRLDPPAFRFEVPFTWSKSGCSQLRAAPVRMDESSSEARRLRHAAGRKPPIGPGHRGSRTNGSGNIRSRDASRAKGRDSVSRPQGLQVSGCNHPPTRPLRGLPHGLGIRGLPPARIETAEGVPTRFDDYMTGLVLNPACVRLVPFALSLALAGRDSRPRVSGKVTLKKFALFGPFMK